MRRSLAVVYSKSGRAKASLHGWVSEPEPKPYEIELESEGWFAWLGQGQSFRLTYWPTGLAQWASQALTELKQQLRA
jgi:hypothetical protein